MDRQTFQELFQVAPQATAAAPGRVNLIGEHTDYNGGYVLPTVIPQRTRAELAPLHGDEVAAFSANLGDGPQRFRLGEERRTGEWLDYVQGLTTVLRGAGYGLSGFALRVESDIPIGSGLSSSASLLVAVLRALRAAFGLAMDDVTLALLAKRAENDFVGAPVGVMDQMACSLADEGTALFLDTRSLCFERVPLPPGGEIVVLDSGVAHRHAGGEYVTCRAECERAAALLGVPALRDVGPADLPRAEALPEPLGRRVRHVVTENQRVLAMVEALRTGDLRRVGALLYEAHDSLRDDFQVSIREIDLIVSLARAEPDIFGARLCGGGFGGSVVMMAVPGRGRAAAERIAGLYAARTGRPGAVLVPAHPSGAGQHQPGQTSQEG